MEGLAQALSVGERTEVRFEINSVCNKTLIHPSANTPIPNSECNRNRAELGQNEWAGWAQQGRVPSSATRLLCKYSIELGWLGSLFLREGAIYTGWHLWVAVTLSCSWEEWCGKSSGQLLKGEWCMGHTWPLGPGVINTDSPTRCIWDIK